MWSPQQYKQKGLEQGCPEDVLEAAIAQSNKLINSPNKLPPILSLKHLSDRTGVSYQELKAFINRSDFSAYEKFSIKKRSGGRRFIHVPTPRLMHTQRWINEFILKNIQVHSASHAFVVGSSIQKCALNHCGAKWLIKLDITDFFESISEIQIYRVFKELGYQPLVAFQLSRLCTVPTSWLSPRGQYRQWHVREDNKIIPEYTQRLMGYLPQGAATSPLISNLVMRECDEKLNVIARNNSMTYTRYSDDLTFSTRSKCFGRINANNVIYEVYKVLSESGYRPQFRKTKIIPPGSKKIVLGLNVDGPLPRLQKEYKDRIRQHLYYLDKLGISTHVSSRGFDSIWGFKCHLKGMIDYANMIEPEFTRDVLSKFSSLDWPV